MRIQNLALIVAAGTGLSLAGVSQAQQLINISGASLLENFVRAPGSTNDFIDVDNNGTAGKFASPTIQQLVAPTVGSSVWHVQYRVVGSVNGFRELTQFGYPAFVTTGDDDAMGILGGRPTAMPPINGLATTAYRNRVAYISGGASTGAYNLLHAGGAPDRAQSNGANRSIIGTAAPSVGGITIDIAPLDVSTRWATQKPGVGAVITPTATPLALGYGLNPRVSTGKNGETAINLAAPHLSGGLSSFLAPLNGRNLFDPANPSAADSNTIFDTELSFAPIAPVANLGTGLTQVTMTELRHLFTTGRAITGENFVVGTRDVGSGTRNAFMNCIGIDPSWGVGDNIGGESATTAQSNLGAQFFPNNKTANGGLELVLRAHRLAIGYIGTERGVTGSGSGSWLTNNALEILDTKNDIYGGTTYVRPTVSNIVNNNANGWVIGGQAVLATIGDPGAESIANGGDGNTTPAMVNKSAAAYVNNIRKSVLAFIALPGADTTLFMPGELAATQFLLLNALDNLHDLTNPTTMIPNPGFNANLKTYTLTNNVHTNPAFASFNAASTGRNPTRTALTGLSVYSDNVALGANYISQGGAVVSYGSPTDIRNKIAYDFNGDGVRSLADAPDMIAAWRQRNGGPVWVAPNGVGSGLNACIEILGDGNGDGSFTSADVRYWADGLALSGGQLDRRAGFIAVDNAFSGNFFGTQLGAASEPAVNPVDPQGAGRVRQLAPYAAGGSRADVIGSSGAIARGWAPVGADNRVDGFDIAYVYRQFKQAGITGSADWSNLNEAVLFDLSADMNGDMQVDLADVNEIASNILGTSIGDINLDGRVNLRDRLIATSNVGLAPANITYATGDANGDGLINGDDVTVICPADFNRDFNRNIDDIFVFINAFFQAGSTGSLDCDINDDGIVNIDDIFVFINVWFSGC